MKLIIILALQLILTNQLSAFEYQGLKVGFKSDLNLEYNNRSFPDTTSNTEYKLLNWKIIYEDSADKEKLSRAHYSLAMMYQQENEFDKAIHHFRKSNEMVKTYSSQIEIAKTYIQIQRLNLAKIYLLRLNNTGRSFEEKKLIHKLLISIDIIQENYSNAIKTINLLNHVSNNEYAEQLNEVKLFIIKAQNKSYYKSEKKAGTLSTFFPGLGQLYTNSYKDALNAAVLNSATAYLLVQKVRSKNFIGFTIAASTIWWRFYSGNIENARENANKFNILYLRKNQRQAIHILNRI